MSLRWLLILAAAVGMVQLGPNGFIARSAYAADAAASPAIAVSLAIRAPKQLRAAVAEAIHRANVAKAADRAAAVKALIDVYRELGRDVQLPAKERLRLATQVRTRLQRFASQFHYEIAHANARVRDTLASNANASNSRTGAACGPAVEGLDSLVEAIQTTIGQPDDWAAGRPSAAQPDLVQLAGNAAVLAGGVGVGFGGAGAAHGGGAFGGNAALEKGVEANGADLVDLIQKTVDPPSWDINGGPGSIVFFNNLRVLVVSQTGDRQEDVGGVLGGLRH